MEKYGVLHEYKCECGQMLIVPDNDPDQLLSKHASAGEHKHEWKEVLELEIKNEQ